jgi:hypothetical protein
MRVITWSGVLHKYMLFDFGYLIDIAFLLMAIGYIVDKAV